MNASEKKQHTPESQSLHGWRSGDGTMGGVFPCQGLWQTAGVCVFGGAFFRRFDSRSIMAHT